MIKVSVTLNATALKRTLETGFDSANGTFGQDARAEMDAVKWAWSRKTHRKNGEIAFTPRNIVDTGTLKGSYRHQKLTRLRHRHEWRTEYALGVHQGFTFKDGTVIHARPWTRAPKARLLQNFASATNL